MNYEHSHYPHGAEEEHEELWTDLAEIPDTAYEDEEPDHDRYPAPEDE